MLSYDSYVAERKARGARFLLSLFAAFQLHTLNANMGNRFCRLGVVRKTGLERDEAFSDAAFDLSFLLEER